MALSEILKLSSKVAGVASAVPGFGMWAKPISAVLGFAGNMVPQGNNNVNQGGVDVTNQVKGSSNFQYQNPGITYPQQVQNNQNIPQGQSTLNPYGIIMNGMVKGYNDIMTSESGGTKSYLNPMSTGVINYKGYEPAFDNNMQVPNGFNDEMNSFQNKNVESNINTMQQPTDTRALKNALYGTDGTQSLLNWNKTMQTQGVIKDPNQKWLDMATTEQAKTDKMVNTANTYNAIGQGITGVGSLLSIINEVNKQPSEMLQPSQYRTSNLESNQSAFINANTKQIENSKNAQQRLLQDLGVDPLLAGINTEKFSSDQTLKVLSEAERTRQGILSSQEQINASIQAQANDSLQKTRMFNIQKQLQENQMGGANLSAAITGLAGSVIGYGSGTLANNYWGELTKANTRQSFLGV